MKPDTLEKVLETIKFEGEDGEGEIYFAKFDKTIKLGFIERPEVNNYYKKCIETFFKWDDALFEKLAQASFDYYQDFLEAVGPEDMPVIKSPSEVLNYCQPVNLNLDADDKNRSNTFITVELDCDWEIEHGMQWTVKNDNELVFVGAYDGVSIDYAPQAYGNFARK